MIPLHRTSPLPFSRLVLRDEHIRARVPVPLQSVPSLDVHHASCATVESLASGWVFVSHKVIRVKEAEGLWADDMRTE